MPHVLFVSHDATRTGAPLALLHLLEWLKPRAPFEFSVLLGRSGDLEPRFRALCAIETWDAPEEKPSLVDRIFRRMARLAGTEWGHQNRVLQGLRARGVGLVYANSAASARLIPPLELALRVPIVCHVHELDYMLRRHAGLRTFMNTRSHVHHYVAASEVTRQNLVRSYDIPAGKTSTIYEAIPTQACRELAGRMDPEALRRDLQIPANAYIVATGGTPMHWRKGPDAFVQVGRELVQQADREVFLLWVGGPAGGEEFDRLIFDVERLGLGGRFRVTGLVENPFPYIALADVFLLTSREDPFPLICLEAGALSKPVVCFAGGGGAPELLADGRGFTVPYLSTRDMSRVVLDLMNDPETGRQSGQRLCDHVSGHHDVSVTGEQVLRLIQDLLQSAEGQPMKQRY